MTLIKLVCVTAVPALLLSAFATYGFEDDKSHKEAWSDPVGMSRDGMLPSLPDIAPHPLTSHLEGAGPMVASLGNQVGSRETLAQDPGAPGASPATGGAAAGAAANEAMKQGEKLDDEKILDIAHVANVGEIDQAKLALTRARDPRIKKLARMMITQHSAAERNEAAVVRKKSLNMVATKTSDSLQRDAKATYDVLKNKSGAEFDHAYIDAQVKEHQALLTLIDDRLKPAATDPAIKELVASLRSAVQAHLAKAETLQPTLKE
ncbi:MAG: DUF4142 domain-containing protein [Polyangia bacterium]